MRVARYFVANALIASLALSGSMFCAACQFDSSAPNNNGNVPVDAAGDGPVVPNDGPGNLPDADLRPTGCPAGFETVDGAPVTSKYKLVTQTSRWVPARKTCREMTAGNAKVHLVATETNSEFQALIDLLTPDTQVTTSFHLGVTRYPMPQTPWQWITGPLLANDVLPPDTDNDGYSCMRIRITVDGADKTIGVSDTRCDGNNSLPAQYVCECENLAGDDTNIGIPGE